jgi:hypothetical protein
MLSLMGGSLPWQGSFTTTAIAKRKKVAPLPISIPHPTGNIAKGQDGDFWSGVFKGMLTIVVMGFNAFFAALSTQVYKIFTKKWRDGGGSEIPVINTTPGDGSSSKGGGPPGGGSSSSSSGRSTVSSDFLNRYRD